MIPLMTSCEEHSALLCVVRHLVGFGGELGLSGVGRSFTSLLDGWVVVMMPPRRLGKTMVDILLAEDSSLSSTIK